MSTYNKILALVALRFVTTNYRSRKNNYLGSSQSSSYSSDWMQLDTWLGLNGCIPGRVSVCAGVVHVACVSESGTGVSEINGSERRYIMFVSGLDESSALSANLNTNIIDGCLFAGVYECMYGWEPYQDWQIY